MVAEMLEVDQDFLSHWLALNLSGKLIMQKRWKLNDGNREAMKEETTKLLKADHIQEIQYPK